MKNISINSIDELERGAEEFLNQIGDYKIIAFYGKMGAGKTTFIKALCKVLGVIDGVNSPTFTLINEYRSADGLPLFHFDFYRIEKPVEAFDIGIEEFFESGYLCLIEWPEKIEQILPTETLKVKISVQPDDSRLISF
jgi:tRNA threonylcarbamoyladenosine biosynthesis protein TsaE